ncbi:MAG TPA: 2-C-methyl-D-erythritol 2,4-cyclodiphosphate synthase [Bacillota bacterium]
MQADAFRVGFGFDVHAFAPARPLVLGGVRIPYERGLAGHSDADVLTHAVMDALLGAAGTGDIGLHFPDSDPSLRGAFSLALLAQVASQIAQRGWYPVNLDATVVAQAPRLAPHIPAMRRNLAERLSISEGRVNIKATTSEGLGFTGRGEGIAAFAVCLLGRLPSPSHGA